MHKKLAAANRLRLTSGQARRSGRKKGQDLISKG